MRSDHERRKWKAAWRNENGHGRLGAWGILLSWGFEGCGSMDGEQGEDLLRGGGCFWEDVEIYIGG